MLQMRIIILLSTVLALAAADGFDRSISINIWRDRPSEAMQEINARLPPGERLAWYVAAPVDEGVYPGPVVEEVNKPVRTVLDDYCAAVGLTWSGHDRFVWIHKAPDAAATQAAAAALTGADVGARSKAIDSLIHSGTPADLAALLTAWAGSTGEVRAAAREGVAIFLGVPRSQLRDRGMLGYALWGHPDRSRTFMAPALDFGALNMPAPWAAAAISMADDAVSGAVTTMIKEHPKLQADVVALTLAALAKAPSVQEPLTNWINQPTATGGWNRGGWEENYIRTAAARLFAYALPAVVVPLTPKQIKAQKRKKGKKSTTPPDDGRHPAAVVHEYVVTENANALFNQARVEIDKLQREIQAASANGLSPDAKKAFDKRKRAIDGIQKRANDLLKRQMGQINKLAKAKTDPELIKVLAALISDREQVYDLLRESAAKAAGEHRDPGLVEPLADCLNNDDQPRAQVAAAMSLAAQRENAGQELLYAALANESSVSMRKYAIRALARSRHPDGAAKVLARLKVASENAERQVILQFLGVFREPMANELLITTMQSSEASLPDRLSSAVALTRVPTDAARKALAELLANDPNVRLKQEILVGLTPRKPSDVALFANILYGVAESEREDAVLQRAVEALQYAARFVGEGHPVKARVKDSSVKIITDKTYSSNIRKLALNSFKYTDVDAELAAAIEAAYKSEKSPILKRFIKTALGKVRARLPKPDAPQE